MNTEQFITELATIFDRTPKPAQVVIYRDKLRRFTPEQLLEILNKVLEEAKGFPKVSEIYKAAQELGFLVVDTHTTRPHRWQPSDCRLCRGEGRLAIIWEFSYERRGDGYVEVQRMKHIFPYAAALQEGFKIEAGHFQTVFRCSCLAGEAVTIPKVFPKWRSDYPLQREVWK